MKIALIGYGKMNQLVDQLAVERGHQICSIFRRNEALADRFSELEEADVLIDFSHQNQVEDSIKMALSAKKNIVIGTTGWEGRLSAIELLLADSQIGVLYSPNFSWGMHLFAKIVKEAAGLIQAFPDYDIGIAEIHHNQKTDSPSGTAKMLASLIVQNNSRKKETVTQFSPESCQDAVHISSLRCGNVPGTHSVLLSSSSETITLTHQAQDRKGFALGAIRAAEWLQGRRGLFTMDHLI